MYPKRMLPRVLPHKTETTTPKPTTTTKNPMITLIEQIRSQPPTYFDLGLPGPATYSNESNELIDIVKQKVAQACFSRRYHQVPLPRFVDCTPVFTPGKVESPVYTDIRRRFQQLVKKYIIFPGKEPIYYHMWIFKLTVAGLVATEMHYIYLHNEILIHISKATCRRMLHVTGLLLN